MKLPDDELVRLDARAPSKIDPRTGIKISQKVKRFDVVGKTFFTMEQTTTPGVLKLGPQADVCGEAVSHWIVQTNTDLFLDPTFEQFHESWPLPDSIKYFVLMD